MKSRRIGIVGYNRVQALDVTGPADVFTTANYLVGRKVAPYEVVLLAQRKGPMSTESGVFLYAETTLSRCGKLDTIIVPGGHGVRLEPKVRTAIVAWLRSHARYARRVASVCTGIYALAEAGLMDGRAATTHWRYAHDVQERWKKIDVDADVIFVKDGQYYTSAGITAGLDLALALVEEDLGSEIALGVARELVVYLKRAGGQLQYSQPLFVQTRAKKQFADIASWISDHLGDELTTEKLSEHAGLSPRHFARKFKDLLGLTPGDFVEEVRLDRARWLLATADTRMQNVAKDVGYRSDDVFRRAFQRRFGVSPSEYRRRFGGVAA